MVFLIKIIFEFFFILIFTLIFYEIVLFILSLFFKRNSTNSNEKRKFLILIPAFGEGDILLSTVDALEKLNYPGDLLDIVLLNDGCDERVLKNIKHKIKILDVNLEAHSKIESLKKAIDLTDNFDFVIILDADNLVHHDFLKELNKSITEKTKVIQGLRLPKNLNSKFEKLDAMTDFVYNQLDRIAPSKLGLSGTLSGSGFAIRTDLFKQIIPEINTKGGFDKILQSELMLQNIPVEVCKTAIVFDEKISSRENYIRQRTRWLYYHFYNSINYGIKILLTGIFHFNLNQIHFGLKTLRPPINLLYFLSLILVIAGLWFCPVCSIILFAALIIFSLIIANILRINKLLSFELLISLPLIFINQLFSIFRLREAKENSLRTEHYHSKTIDEVLQDSKSLEQK
ncbi:MAG: glycosyltransferase [Ignavibacteria bacterium]